MNDQNPEDLMQRLCDRIIASRLVHWVGTAPTSLHGNGASSFKASTTDVNAVTCNLCLTLIARGEHRPPAWGEER